ncbi:MAG: glycerophosphodiester phosphodiesterase [Elusimicrobia bacterium]|nr:glycerophosphodiester phosphodiesterase [Elusimicrobiota bacterium]
MESKRFLGVIQVRPGLCAAYLSAILLSAILLSGQAWAAPSILVHGHRGCRGVRPENTLAAFQEALDAGVDVLELDMSVTRDGVVVVSHDKEIDPAICLAPGGKPADKVPIRSLTFLEVQAYDCGSLKNPRFPRQVPVPGERIPRLAEVFQLVKDSTAPAARTVEFNIETKIVPGEPDLSPSPAEFARLVVAVVREYGLESRVMVQSFDRRTLAEVAKLDRRIRRSMLISDNLPDLVAVAKAQKVAVISPDALWLTKADVDALHGIGVQVAPWTVNDETGWAALIGAGVDAIITDYPQDLLAYLKKRGLR